VLKDIAGLPHESTKCKREKMETVPASDPKFGSQQRRHRFQRAHIMFQGRIEPSLRPGYGSISEIVGNMWQSNRLIICGFPNSGKETAMKDFSNAAFSPDEIEAMDEALQGAVATLPDPVSSMRVQNIAESILRSAHQGERNPRALQTMALVEMQLRSDEK